MNGTEWRDARRVVLHEHYTVLTLPGYEGGIFADFENETWQIESATVNRVLDVLGVNVPPKQARDMGIVIDRIPAHSGSNIYEGAYAKGTGDTDRIQVRVLGERLIELRITRDHGAAEEWTQEITYSGGFTVEWAQPSTEPA